ncbi:hypothetical protein [Marinoscillum sp.]|uniref:hypothetical protein n=1 Tax=Marinoscillum sp. TaxID=2024838 RepID=UPI003BACB12B
MQSSKPRVIKDFEKLDAQIQEQIKLAYPYGFYDSLIHFYNKEGQKVSALPFETDEKYYMVRMTIAEAKAIVADDDDFDEDGNLKDDIKDDYENKYSDLDYMSDYIADDSGDDGDEDE